MSSFEEFPIEVHEQPSISYQQRIAYEAYALLANGEYAYFQSDDTDLHLLYTERSDMPSNQPWMTHSLRLRSVAAYALMNGSDTGTRSEEYAVMSLQLGEQDSQLADDDDSFVWKDRVLIISSKEDTQNVQVIDAQSGFDLADIDLLKVESYIAALRRELNACRYVDALAYGETDPFYEQSEIDDVSDEKPGAASYSDIFDKGTLYGLANCSNCGPQKACMCQKFKFELN